MLCLRHVFHLGSYGEPANNGVNSCEWAAYSAFQPLNVSYCEARRIREIFLQGGYKIRGFGDQLEISRIRATVPAICNSQSRSYTYDKPLSLKGSTKEFLRYQLPNKCIMKQMVIILNPLQIEPGEQGIRLSEWLRSKPKTDHKHPHFHWSCGGCGELDWIRLNSEFQTCLYY